MKSSLSATTGSTRWPQIFFDHVSSRALVHLVAQPFQVARLGTVGRRKQLVRLAVVAAIYHIID